MQPAVTATPDRFNHPEGRGMIARKLVPALVCLVLAAVPVAEALAQTVPHAPSLRRNTPKNTFLDVRADFGALCNDEADDLAAFTAAVKQAEATGGAHIMVPGICRVSGTIQVNASNITFMGLGNRVSMLRTTSATAPILVFGDGVKIYSSNYVDNLGFASTVPRTAGAAVRFDKISQGGFSRGYTVGQFRGIEITGTSAIITVADSRFVQPGAASGSAIYIDGVIEAQLHNITIAGERTAQPYAGVHVVKASGMQLENVGAVHCGIGLALVPSPGSTIEHIFASRNAWDSNARQGLLIQAGPGTTVRRAVFTGDWTATNTQDGILTTGAGAIQDISFIGHRSVNNGGHGARFASGTDIGIVGGTFSGNSTSSIGAYSGILFDTISGFRAEGVRAGAVASFGNTQKFGIDVGNAGSNNYILTGNDVRTNAKAAMALASPVGSTRIVRDNLGYALSNSGRIGSPGTDGSGDLTVSHGLAETPTKVFVQVAGGTPDYRLSSHAYGPKTFKIRVFDATGKVVPSKAVPPVVWQAER